MKIEKVHSGIRYTLSNEGLRVGDRVFPIALVANVLYKI